MESIMRRTVTGLLAAASFVAVSASANANDFCRECWGQAAVASGMLNATQGYLTGYIPGPPYTGYPTGLSSYPHVTYNYPQVRVVRSVRYANKTYFVPPAAFDPARRR